MRKTYKLLMAAAMLSPLAMAASAPADAIINLTLTVNTTAKTWAAFETYTGSTASSGLGGLQFDVIGSGGAVVTSSTNRLPSGSDDDFGPSGFSTLRSNGTAGAAIRGYQPNTYSINSFNDATSVYLAVGQQGETINKGDSGGTPTNVTITNPVQIATGAYTGTSGFLTISGLTTQATLLPGTMPTATTNGAAYQTFSPDTENGQTVSVAVPEPASIGLLGAGALGLLVRRRRVIA